MALTAKELRKKSQSIEPTVRIGKSGISDSQIKEIKKQLKTKKLVKIKFLKSFLDSNEKKEAIKKIALKTDSQVILAVGFTFTLYKK